MSSRLLLAVAALAAAPLLAPAAQAQAVFGVRAGLNVSDFTGDDAPANADPRLGFSGGVFAHAPIGASGLYVQPEVLYSMKGVTSDNDGTLAVDYVEVPLLLGYAIPVTQTGLMLGAYAGPALGIKVGESISQNFGTITGSRDSDVFEDLDIGAAVGATVGAGAFGVDARYTFGLMNALDVADSSLRNGAFTVAATYRFGR